MKHNTLRARGHCYMFLREGVTHVDLNSRNRHVCPGSTYNV